MDESDMTDAQFLDTMEHHFHAQYLPPFGDQSFFNSGLFHYVIHEAANDLPHLNREMDRLRQRFGTDTHRIKMRVHSDPPRIAIKLHTPTGSRKMNITNGEIAVRPIASDE